MKLMCDLCGGSLQMNSGGQGAVCVHCGLGYTMEHLRGKLARQRNGTQTPSGDVSGAVKPPVDSPISKTPSEEKETDIRDILRNEAKRKGDFVMTLKDVFSVSGSAAVYGTVESGEAACGDALLLNGKQRCTVVAIVCNDKPQSSVCVGVSAAIMLDGVELNDLAAGDVLTRDGKKTQGVPNGEADSFRGRLLNSSSMEIGARSRQFVMKVSGAKRMRSKVCLMGLVQQGSAVGTQQVSLDSAPGSLYRVSGAVGVDGDHWKQMSAGTEVYLYLDCPMDIMKRATVALGEADPPGNLYNSGLEAEDYFASVLLDELNDCRIYADAWFKDVGLPVNFLICRDDRPVLAVFLLDSWDGKRRSRVNRAIIECGRHGLPAMQFFTDYRNDAGYVAERVRGGMLR